MSRREVPRPGLISRIAHRFGFHVTRTATHDVLPRHFYSPLPDATALPDELWTQPSELAGIRFDEAGQMEFVDSALVPYLAEFATDLSPDGRIERFELENGYYSSGDADALYAMVRHLHPRRVIEVGSGVSSLVIEHAVARNALDGNASEVRIFDPYPSDLLSQSTRREVQAIPAQEIPLDTFQELRQNDILFVDTSHTVKVGGDVNRLVLDVLPLLAPGVVVHFHDVFLPWNYHRTWARFGWAEQYLLQAFLSLNDDFDVVLGLHALSRSDPEWLEERVEGFHPGGQPSAFWIRRRAVPTSAPAR